MNYVILIIHILVSIAYFTALKFRTNIQGNDGCSLTSAEKGSQPPFHLSTKIIPSVGDEDPASNSPFFVWGDNLDKTPYLKEFYYGRICSILQKTLFDESNPLMIISNATEGGLGHKMLSIFHSITYALATNRRWYLNISDPFWKVTRSCLSPGRYYPSSSIHPNPANFSHPAKRFSSTQCSSSPLSASEQLPSNISTILMIDCRMHNDVFYMPSTVRSIRDLALIQPHQSILAYQRIVLRLLLTPSLSLQVAIRSLQGRHQFRRRKVLGVQVRTAGCFATNMERYQMMTLPHIYQLPQLIQAQYNDLNKTSDGDLSPAIFLSTDSYQVEGYLRKELPAIEIVTSGEQRRHSGGRAEEAAVRGELVDLILLADCDRLLITPGSGFGQIASIITRAKTIRKFPVSGEMMSEEDYQACLLQRPSL